MSPFRDNYNSLWSNLKTNGITMSDFNITNLDPHKKFYYCWVLSLPFDDGSVVLIKRFVASVVGKLRTAKLRELEAPWLTK